MARAWLLSPKIGTGTREDPYRPAIADVPAQQGDRREYVVSGPRNQALCAVDAAEVLPLRQVQGVRYIGDDSRLDMAVSVFDQATRTRLAAIASEFGVDGTRSVRVLTRALGRKLHSNFDERQHLGSAIAPRLGSFVSDTFTDAEATTLESHVGETGSAWTKHPYTSGSPSAVISSGRVLGPGGPSSWYYASGIPPAPEYSVAADFRVVAAVGDSDYTSIFSRLDPVISGQGYYLEYGRRFSEWKLVKMVYVDWPTFGPAYTLLGSFVLTLTGGVDSPAVLETLNATKKAYVLGVERLSSTDNEVTAAGRAGLTEVYPSIALDNFVASTPPVGQDFFINQATESDAAHSGPSLVKTAGIAQTLEGELAQPIAAASSVGISPAQETDTADVLTAVRQVGISPAQETNAVFSLGGVLKLAFLAQAVEGNFAGAMAVEGLEVVELPIGHIELTPPGSVRRDYFGHVEG